MGYGSKKSKPKGKGTKKNHVCISHETYGGKGRPANPTEIAAFGI